LRGVNGRSLFTTTQMLFGSLIDSWLLSNPAGVGVGVGVCDGVAVAEGVDAGVE